VVNANPITVATDAARDLFTLVALPYLLTASDRRSA
jgi:hypothetical protein